MAGTLSVTLIALLLYAAVMAPFGQYMRNKPVEEKLGYVPSVAALKSIAADHKEFVAASLVLKVLMYFGAIMEKEGNRLALPPDYPSMSRLLHGAVKLDPYNMDAYYFAQSFLTWDVGQYKLAIDLLDYGMKYRSWDWQLPFFAGFNSVFFLKDYSAGAKYYLRAGELSGSDLSRLLAGRYMQQSGQTESAVNYLSVMYKSEKNPALKKNYLVRLNAYRETLRIERARDIYQERYKRVPASLEQLVADGLLTPPPKDPYGGLFYLEADGRVATTSKYAFAGARSNGAQKRGAADERH